MRTLEKSLPDHELIVLRVIGEWLGLDLTGEDKNAALKILSSALAQVDLMQEMVYLEPEEAATLRDLAAENGRIPVATFERQHGEVRKMGPGMMEREEPWLDPVSPAEALWYRGFLFRGFENSDENQIEYYYLPAEFAAQFPTGVITENPPAAVTASLRPVAAPLEYEAADSSAVDDLATLLILAQQQNLQSDKPLAVRDEMLLDPDRDRRSLLMTLAGEMGLVRRDGKMLRPTRTALAWLKDHRETQLRSMAEAWQPSAWNDLRHTPGLICEGEAWQNDPVAARQTLLKVLARTTDWYEMSAVIEQISATDPDFQRPDGNYETWYIRDEVTREYLSGFANWDSVEGRLLRFLISGPLSWLGMVEYGEKGHFRLTARGVSWLEDDSPPTSGTGIPLMVQPDATLLAPRHGSAYDRFQAARFAEMRPPVPDGPYVMAITPASLAGAAEQGITADRVLSFLEKAGGRPAPAGIQRAIRRWSEKGVEARLQSLVVLRVSDAAILDTLRNNPKTRDLIAESLGDLAVVIRKNDWEAFRRATPQLGLLVETDSFPG